MNAFLRSCYYQLKPILPWRFRMAVRRARALHLRKESKAIWPIDPRAGVKPGSWPGWPRAKAFSFILTHDVESEAGVRNCRSLMALEKELGFRSCFNFVPEGHYKVPADLLNELVRDGFEIGVHDLRHDGKLFQSAHVFCQHALRINQYLRKWNAVGFRSAYMLRNLEWLHQLEIHYDASTFDTDPFEPQSEGEATVFPFWVESGRGGGYVELPYTLVQDFTLFLLLREEGPAIWKQKLDWIAQQGGMALLDTHPDYMDFGQPDAKRTYPIAHYRALLEYVRDEYAGEYWHALPKEVASYVTGMIRDKQADSTAAPRTRTMGSRSRSRKVIWIDLDNTPHVPFFLPIISELQRRGYEVAVTARDAFQVCQLADLHKVKYQSIGRHYGKHKVAKVLGLFFRATQLMPFALRQKPGLAVSHGSRAQMIACNLLRIPTILIADYEHAQTPPLMRPKWELAPEAIPDADLHSRRGYIRKYSGIKEDVYAWTLVPDSSLLSDLGIDACQLIAVVRPPANEAHYHNPESDLLFEAVMHRLGRTPNLRVILLPRNRRQEQSMRQRWPDWFSDQRVVVPAKALDGLNLIWHADLVISGGGTMNRESAALGVPVYSIFRGPIGAVDRLLEVEKRLTLIRSVEEVESKILLRKRDKAALTQKVAPPALSQIVDHIETIFRTEQASSHSA